MCVCVCLFVCVCVCIEEDEESGFFLTGLDIENGNEDTADVDVLGCEVGGGQERERERRESEVYFLIFYLILFVYKH